MNYLLRSITFSALALSLINPSFARPYDRHADHSFIDKARVVKVKAIYETIERVTPEEKCWEEKVVNRRNNYQKKDYGGLVVGGILGGVAGHQVGRGRGNDVATVAGSLIGAIIGDNVANSSRPSYQNYDRYTEQVSYETRCDTIEKVTSYEEIVAYKVKYRYKGNVYWTRTKNHPGKYIDVKVNVRPAHKTKW